MYKTMHTMVSCKRCGKRMRIEPKNIGCLLCKGCIESLGNCTANLCSFYKLKPEVQEFASVMEFEEQSHICDICGEEYTYTVQMQQYDYSHGIFKMPHVCPHCMQNSEDYELLAMEWEARADEFREQYSDITGSELAKLKKEFFERNGINPDCFEWMKDPDGYINDQLEDAFEKRKNGLLKPIDTDEWEAIINREFAKYDDYYQPKTARCIACKNQFHISAKTQFIYDYEGIGSECIEVCRPCHDRESFRRIAIEEGFQSENSLCILCGKSFMASPEKLLLKKCICDECMRKEEC